MANGGIIGTVNNPTSSTATGVWQQEEQYEAVRDGTWPEKPLFTTKSCRFNDGDSANLYKTPSSTGNRRKFTFSTWLKRASAFGVQQVFFGSWNANSDAGYTSLRFTDADQLNLTGWNTNWFVTSRKFRDPSAWYHIVLSIDTENGTAGNRMRLYINGVEETSFSTNNNPSQNQDLSINVSGSEIYIASNEINGSKSNFLDGYLAETVLIDGQQLAPTSFGSTNSDGVWTPIPYTGTFGTNGFNLQFENAAALGTDSSPNGNTFTVSNLTSIDQSTDYPENNFAVGNPLLNYNPNLSEGNLLLASTGTAWKNAMSTIGLSSGKWYHEVLITAESGVPYGLIGVTDSYHPNSWGASPPNYVGVGALQIGYFNNNGTYYKSDSQNSYGASFTVNDIIGVLLDLDAGTPTIKFYKNDADQGSINLPTDSNSTGLWFLMQSVYIQTMSVNYGSPAHAISSGNTDGNGYGNFEFATKGGYTLNTANLAEFG